MPTATPIQGGVDTLSSRYLRYSATGGVTGETQLSDTWLKLFDSTEPCRLWPASRQARPFEGNVASTTTAGTSTSTTPLLEAIVRGFEIWAESRTTIAEVQRTMQQFAAGWQQWQHIIADAATRVAEVATTINALTAPVVDALGHLPASITPSEALPLGWQSVDASRPAQGIAGALNVPQLPLPDTAPGPSDTSSVDTGVGSRPYAVFKKLGTWLHASDDEIADAVGVGRTTPYAWQRESRTPTPRTLRRLYQMSSALSAVVQHLGEERATTWLYENGERRRQLLLAGELRALDADIDAVVFDGGPVRVEPGTWVPEDRASVDAVE